MSKLLINEPPLQVLPSLVMAIGLNEAIVLQQIQYWINKGCGKRVDGKVWIFNTYEKWQKDNFPFWSVSTIQRIFLRLEEEGLIFSEQFDKASYDHKKYYRINYDSDKLKDRSQQECAISSGNTESSSLTETTTETTITTSSKNEDVAPTRKPAKQRDPRLDHPTIKAYREIMHLQVPEPLRDDLTKINDPNIASHFKDWLGRGYNPRNIRGILDAYTNGGIGRPKSPAAQEVYQ